MKTRPRLLNAPELIHILKFRLQENQTAEFRFTDRSMAENYYLHLTAVGVIAGSVIKHSEFKSEPLTK